MSLALFDLDNTLLDGDSDRLWTDFLGAQGVLDLDKEGPRMEAFHHQYLAGELDVRAYLGYALGLVAHIPVRDLAALRPMFMEEMIRPRIRQRARDLVERHKANGRRTIIITLTNRLITEPIAEEFGSDDLIATEPELLDGNLTGRIVGQPCYQHGKVLRLYEWLEENGGNLEDSVFYTDSVNDLPLLEAVASPVVVNPDPALREIARQRGWLAYPLAPESRDPA